MDAVKWQAEWQAGMERDERGICACWQVVLIGELAEAQSKLEELRLLAGGSMVVPE